jgi:gluconolactonase
MTAIREIATGLRFPEGPIAMPDGEIVLVEIAARRLSRITSDGRVQPIAELGGGPNGAAIGPGGKCYICNNGGLEWHERGGHLIPGFNETTPGRIQVVDLDTGKFETLYDSCDGRPFSAPNDLVFDSHGGFWFTDHAKTSRRERVRGSLYYAKADGSSVKEVISQLDGPNGVGLSPDETRVYVAETNPGRIWAFDIARPGEVAKNPNAIYYGRGHLLAGVPGYQLFDSLAVDSGGWVCVATIHNGGITAASPDGKTVTHTPLPDSLVTNICFGGKDLRTAYATLSGAGKLVAFDWPRPGLALNYLNK